MAGPSSWVRLSTLQASLLPASWRGRERFVVLEAGCGGVLAFLACWRAWRDDPHACRRLHFISVTPQPLGAAALNAALSAADAAWPELAVALVAAWPAATPNLHRLAFDDGRVQLLLAHAPLDEALGELVAEVDAFLLGTVEGAAPRRLAKALARLAAPGALLRTAPPRLLRAAPSRLAMDAVFRAALHASGFVVERSVDGLAVEAAKPGSEVLQAFLTARYAPAFVPRRPPARRARRVASEQQASERHALIVGGGLAGCATAWALAEHGWRSTVLERHDDVAREASGNPAGLFHGIVNRQDGTHARFNRAAALEVQRVVRAALAAGVCGQQQGLLRLEITQTHRASLAFDSMQAALQRLRLPPDYVQALSADAAAAQAGLPLDAPAWFYPGGGWVDPAGLARHYLERAGAAWRGGCSGAALRRVAGAWELLDGRGHVIARSATVVLANAADALRLLGAPEWPVTQTRGQISVLQDAAALGWRLPRLPLTGAGYLLPEVRGAAIWGATAQAEDSDPAVRAEDHQQNLAQLARLLGTRLPVDPLRLEGRTAWRCVSDDRLPIVGAVPAEAGTLALLPSRQLLSSGDLLSSGELPSSGDLLSSGNSSGSGQLSARPPDQPCHVARLPGLYVCTALGSRGITWSALAAQVLASAITGAPAPLEASLLDAIDPARFVARRNRRASAHQP